MASILTNTSAMVALQNLRTINSNLEDTQNQISTGKKISSATDNSLLFIRGSEKPHQQEERHHGRHKVRIGDLPGAAVMAACDNFFTLNDNRRVGIGRHVPKLPNHPRPHYRRRVNKRLKPPHRRTRITRAIRLGRTQPMLRESDPCPSQSFARKNGSTTLIIRK